MTHQQCQAWHFLKCPAETARHRWIRRVPVVVFSQQRAPSFRKKITAAYETRWTLGNFRQGHYAVQEMLAPASLASIYDSPRYSSGRKEREHLPTFHYHTCEIHETVLEFSCEQARLKLTRGLWVVVKTVFIMGRFLFTKRHQQVRTFPPQGIESASLVENEGFSQQGQPHQWFWSALGYPPRNGKNVPDCLELQREDLPSSIHRTDSFTSGGASHCSVMVNGQKNHRKLGGQRRGKKQTQKATWDKIVPKLKFQPCFPSRKRKSEQYNCDQNWWDLPFCKYWVQGRLQQYIKSNLSKSKIF